MMHLQHIANHNQLMVTKAKKQDHSRNKVTSPNQRLINLWAVIFRKCVHWWPVFALFPFDLFWVFGGLQWVQKPHFLLFPMATYVVNIAQLFTFQTQCSDKNPKGSNFREKSSFQKRRVPSIILILLWSSQVQQHLLENSFLNLYFHVHPIIMRSVLTITLDNDNEYGKV